MQALEYDDIDQCRLRMQEQLDTIQEFPIEDQQYEETKHLLEELTEVLDEYATSGVETILEGLKSSLEVANIRLVKMYLRDTESHDTKTKLKKENEALKKALLRVETRLEELVPEVNDRMDQMGTVEEILSQTHDELADHETDERTDELIDIADELDD